MYNILSIGRASPFVSTTQTEEENLCWVRCPPIPLQKISAKVFSGMANGSPWLLMWRSASVRARVNQG